MKQTKKPKQKFLQIISNTLIILSFGILLFIYIPYLELFIPQKKVQAVVSEEFTITIPSINAQSKVIENVNPWSEEEYQKALDKGVAHAKGTSIPGKDGLIFLFAHSSEPPWRMTRTNTPFLKLPMVKRNDKIYISKNSRLFVYKVINKITVNPSDTSYLKDTKSNILILQTCTPPGTALKRLLIFAEEIKS